MKNNRKIETLHYPVFLNDANWEELDSFLHHNRPDGRLFILMDENTYTHCFPLLTDHIPFLHNMPFFVFAPGESSKNIDTLAAIWNWMLEKGMERKDLLINLGGGLVSDLGGFAAATYKRGIRFLNMPTSLLGQADAAIGGKTGINFSEVKNLIGAFHDPLAVFIMSVFLKTLPFRHLRNGMAEIIKCSFLESPHAWEKLQSIAGHWQENVSDMLQDSVRFKCNVVAMDPFDLKHRQMLNFGHTIGHGLEGGLCQAESQKLLHGEAVAVGLICESFLATEMGLMDKRYMESMTEVVMTVFDLSPVDHILVDKAIQRMSADKKNAGGIISFALAEGPGMPALGISAGRSDILKAFAHYNSLLSL